MPAPTVFIGVDESKPALAGYLAPELRGIALIALLYLPYKALGAFLLQEVTRILLKFFLSLTQRKIHNIAPFG